MVAGCSLQEQMLLGLVVLSMRAAQAMKPSRVYDQLILAMLTARVQAQLLLRVQSMLMQGLPQGLRQPSLPGV